jgi:hypothetical protein
VRAGGVEIVAAARRGEAVRGTEGGLERREKDGPAGKVARAHQHEASSTVAVLDETH